MGSDAVHRRAFNLVKAGVNAFVTFLLYKRVSATPAQIDEQTGRRLHIYRFMLKKPITCGTIIKL